MSQAFKNLVLPWVVAALGIGGGGASALAAPWQGECRAQPGEVRSCVLSQSLLGAENDWLATVRVEVKGDAAALQALLPAGVHIGSGIFFSVDDGEEVALDYMRCDDTICEAARALSAKQWAQIRAGRSLGLLYRSSAGEAPSLLNATLEGITAAARELAP